MTSDAIVSKMSEVFAENGSPDRFVSDNGGHHTSHTFQNFATEWDFDHVTYISRNPTDSLNVKFRR